MTIQIDTHTTDHLSKEERLRFDPAEAEMLGILRRFGPQTSSALMTAFGVTRGTVHFRVNQLGDKLETIKAPGRGNNRVYAAR